MLRVACIDLGSNSFHLVIAERRNGATHILARRRERVQLGEGVQAGGRISPQAFVRGLRSLGHFHDLMAQWDVRRCWALGTNAFRAADNAADFIRAAARMGVHISVASGRQEAELIYEGVVSALPAGEEKRLAVDVGGGSSEIIAGRGRRPLVLLSLPAGSITWRDRFFAVSPGNGATLEKAMDQAVAAARRIFAAAAPELRAHPHERAFASSGAARILTGVCREHGFGGGGFSRAALEALLPEMLRAVARDAELPGLKRKRRDLLLPGCAIMLGLMRALDCPAFRFSVPALREGMLDYMLGHRRAGRRWAPQRTATRDYAGL